MRAEPRAIGQRPERVFKILEEEAERGSKIVDDFGRVIAKC